MTEALLLRLIDAGFAAAQMKLERDDVQAAARQKYAETGDADAVAVHIITMRNDAKKAAEDAVK